MDMETYNRRVQRLLVAFRDPNNSLDRHRAIKAALMRLLYSRPPRHKWAEPQWVQGGYLPAEGFESHGTRTLDGRY